MQRESPTDTDAWVAESIRCECTIWFGAWREWIGVLVRAMTCFGLAGLAAAAWGQSPKPATSVVLADKRVSTASDAWMLVVPVALDAAPESLGAYFRDRIDLIRSAMLNSRPAPETADSGQPTAVPDRPSNFFVCLDVFLPPAPVSEPVSPPFLLPRNRDEAARLLRRTGLRDAGTLPWDLLDRYESLIHAWRAVDEESIVRESAKVIRLAVEAALPFNTICEPSLVTAFAPADAADLDRPAVSLLAEDRVVAGRFQAGLVRRLRPRLEHEIRVFPGRFELVGDPLQRVTETLLRARAAIPAFSAADRTVLEELQVQDDASFAARSEAYYILLGRRSGHLLRERLEDGALLAADLLGTAWHVAGRPTMPRSASSPTAEDTKSIAKPAGAESAAAVPEALVGSRNSDKYHRAGCTHTRRIRPDNLVQFESADAARAAGRSPCTVCRPDEPPERSDDASK